MEEKNVEKTVNFEKEGEKQAIFQSPQTTPLLAPEVSRY